MKHEPFTLTLDVKAGPVAAAILAAMAVAEDAAIEHMPGGGEAYCVDRPLIDRLREALTVLDNAPASDLAHLAMLPITNEELAREWVDPDTGEGVSAWARTACCCA